MRRTFHVLLIGGLAMFIAGALQAQSPDPEIIGPTITGNSIWRVDANPASGGVQVCRRVSGPFVEVDVIVQNVPTVPRVLAAHFTVLYDPMVLMPVGAPPLYAGFIMGTSFSTATACCAVPGGPGLAASIFIEADGPCPVAGASVLLARLRFMTLGPGVSEIAIREDSHFFTGAAVPACPGPGGVMPPIGPNAAKAIIVVDPSGTLSALTVNKPFDMAALDVAGRNPDTNPMLGIADITLRSAMQIANAVPGDNRITVFMNNPGGIDTIMPMSALPVINDAGGGRLYLDGTTQPGGFTGLSGAGAGLALVPPDGFTIVTGSNTIDGWAIGLWNAGVRITGAAATLNTIKHNRIGTNVAGTAPMPNIDGVVIAAGASSNDVGQPGANNNNVISGNSSNGVVITGAGSSLNRVRNNLIGLDAAGMSALPNMANGVVINLAAGGNTIGGAASGEGNTVSGNTINGVLLSAAASGNFVEGNNIGTNAAALAAVPNGQSGVRIDVAANANVIGGVNPAAANVIAGNMDDGVLITGAGTDNNQVRRNRIGSNFVVSAIPNQGHGVQIAAAAKSNVIIDNTIEANGTGAVTPPNGDGVLIDGAGTDMNEVTSNFIGAVGLANRAHGVVISNGAVKNLVTLNNIGNNTLNGVRLAEGGTNFNTIIANQIIGNGASGVEITGTLGSPGPLANSIGGSIPAAGNIINGNLADGVRIAWGLSFFVLPGNTIGQNTIAANRVDGVNVIFGVDQHVEDNSIHDNGRNGISVADGLIPGLVGSSQAIAIRRNNIYSNIALGIDLMPGGAAGVTPNDAGDPDSGPNNLQNFPVLTSASSSGVMNGTLSGAASATYTLDFFANDVCDPSGNGEGRTYLGSGNVTTNPGGTATFSLSIGAVSAGTLITATATDSTGNTSEFSACGTVAAPMPCPADLDHNGVVNGLDLALFLGAWTGSISYVPCPPYAPADFNQDCKINGLDLALLLGGWGPCP